MSTEIIQRTPEWHAIRLGKATASRIADIVAKTRSGYSSSRANYAAELIAERLTGVTPERFVNAQMQWGTDREPEARETYEFYHDCQVVEIGFVDHPTITMSGASPDGLVGDDGLIEIKCPLTATHLDTLEGQAVPAKYITQIQWQLACTGRQWCDFASYDPRLPEEMRLFVKRLERDDAMIAELEQEVSAFLAEIAERVERLTERYSLPRAA